MPDNDEVTQNNVSFLLTLYRLLHKHCNSLAPLLQKKPHAETSYLPTLFIESVPSHRINGIDCQGISHMRQKERLPMILGERGVGGE